MWIISRRFIQRARGRSRSLQKGDSSSGVRDVLERWIQKKRRPLIPVISLHELSQSVNSDPKRKCLAGKTINSSLLLGEYPLY
jgi:hypothetical protein